MSRTDARTQLLLAGERLIAEFGPEVSLRDVAVAAGQRNNSAVHYHFGSRDGLIKAIIGHRQARGRAQACLKWALRLASPWELISCAAFFNHPTNP